MASRWRRPLEASAWIVDADHVFLSEQVHARDVLQPVALAVRGAAVLIHQRLDVNGLQTVERFVTMIGAEALQRPTPPGLRVY